MAWDNDLLPEQRGAASHHGIHARLLAGPGTGKTRTLTRRICFLIEDQNVPSQEICALTFTRAAAFELKKRVKDEIGDRPMPMIATLHSFALRQLLKNHQKLTSLPQPLRIADDWEERNIILEDLKSILGMRKIDEAKKLLASLSADWQSLTAEEVDWNQRFPNPQFLGAWQEHREIYGYVLRSELVYQLKRALEQHGNFELEGPARHLLVDEYQDLNRCDLAVVHAIGDRGAEVYVAGDDDQSIYGFRKAHPAGIRRFSDDYPGAKSLVLEVCKRCDQEILDLALFVANQDTDRIQKALRADEGRSGAELALLRFQNQDLEANGIAQICKHLIQNKAIPAHEILILLRTDRHGVFSSVLKAALEAQGIPVGVDTGENNALNQNAGRQVYSILRLLANRKDHLGWRTFIELRANHLGKTAISSIYQLAKTLGVRFTDALMFICSNPSTLSGNLGNRIKTEVESVLAVLDEFLALPELKEGEPTFNLLVAIGKIIEHFVVDQEQRRLIAEQFQSNWSASQPTEIGDLLRGMEVSREEIEQEIKPDMVNILSMHKAKGLTAEAVIIAALESENIPGRAVGGDQLGDERRLLYVSLTRAKHHLFLTYCDTRTGRQSHTGSTSGQSQRSLTRFLSGASITPQIGENFGRVKFEGVKRSGRNMVFVEDTIPFWKRSYAHEEYTPSVAGLGKGENPGLGEVGGRFQADWPMGGRGL